MAIIEIKKNSHKILVHNASAINFITDDSFKTWSDSCLMCVLVSVLGAFVYKPNVHLPFR